MLPELAAHARASLRLWRRSRRLSRALGASRLQRLWLRVVPLVLLWGVPLVGPANRGVPVTFTFHGRAVRCVLGEVCEYEILEEVFVDEVYALTLPAGAATVVDLSSNVGLSALYFMALHPGARVLVVEPNPALFARLRCNVGRFGGVTIAPLAVTDREGAARLHVPAGSWSGRLSDGRGYPISTITLDTLLAKHHFLAVDVLKFDIEGAEFGALRVADLSPVKALVGELHPEHAGEIRDLTTLLEHDFEVHTEPHPYAPRATAAGRRASQPVRPPNARHAPSPAHAEGGGRRRA